MTESCLQVRGVWHPFSELANLSTARGRSRPSAQALWIAAACAAIIGLAVVLGTSGVVARCVVGAIVICAVVTLAGAASYSWHTRPHELWVRCRGDWLLIYASRDAIEFGKVQRAVYRVMRRLAPVTY